MSLIIESSGDFELPPVGNWVGRCYAMIDIGHQYNAQWDQTHPQIIMMVELLDDETRAKDGSPMTINKVYNAYIGEKANLRKDLEGWRGRRFTDEEMKSFNVAKVVDQFGLFNVIHSADGKWANIAGITNVPKQMRTSLPKAVNPVVTFDMHDHRDHEMEALPKWIQDKIKKSIEWTQNFAADAPDEPPPRTDADVPDEDFDDDIPF